MRLKNILNESTEVSDIIKDLDKVRTDLIKKVDVLIAKKKKLYSDVDITTPMSADEKKLDKDIQDIFSQIQQIIQQKRKIKTESVSEGKYYIGYNKGRGQGTGVFKDVFSTYKDAKKELEKIEKQRGGSYHQIAYYVADEKGNFVREVMLGEGRGIKSIQNDLDKTVVAIESEIASYKATKGTPQEKKHVDNLKKLHPIKKKLESELETVVSDLYRDAELKIENLISIKEVTIKVGGNGKTINGYDVDYFKTARGVYANIEIPSPNPTFDDDTQIKGFGKDEKEALNDLKKEFEKYLKKKK
jgi:hypothetical protein